MMKNIIACMLIMTALQSQAQQDGLEVIPKGTKFIGGNLTINFNESATNYPFSDENQSKTTSFGIGPVFGMYLRDNVSLGLGVAYNFGATKNEFADGSSTESSFQNGSVYSFIRKNYKIVPNLFFFLQAQTSLFYGESKYKDSFGNDVKLIGYSVSLGGTPGVQFFLGKKLSLETSLGNIGYQFTHSKNDGSDVYTNNHSLNLSGGLGAINFSIRYFIFP